MRIIESAASQPVNGRRKTKLKELTCQHGIYRASIGSEMVGKVRKPKVWFLGSAIDAARERERLIRNVWDRHLMSERAAGKAKTEVVWIPAIVQTVSSFFADHTDTSDFFASITALPAVEGDFARSSDNVPDRIGNVLTLQGAVKIYFKHLDSQITTTDRSGGNISQRKDSCRTFLRFVGVTPYIPADDKNAPKTPAKLAEYIGKKFAKNSVTAGIAIDKLTYDHLATYATNMKNRQVSQYAAQTVKSRVTQVKDLLEWLEDSKHWIPTCNYSRVLTVNKAKLTTMAEAKKLQSGQDTFSVTELKNLYAAATKKNIRVNRYELYFLLGLNLCATQQQVSDLLVDDVHLDADQPFIEFTRGKTRHLNRGKGITGRYPLWPETVTALKQHLKDNKPSGDYLLSTDDGNRLVWFKGSDRRDAVRSCWERLLKQADSKRDNTGAVAWLGFKHLRKTAGDCVKVLAGGGNDGEYFQQMALAHAKTTVAGRNYSGKDSKETDFDTLSDFIMRLRTEVFKAVFEPESVQKVAA